MESQSSMPSMSTGRMTGFGSDTMRTHHACAPSSARLHLPVAQGLSEQWGWERCTHVVECAWTDSH